MMKLIVGFSGKNNNYRQIHKRVICSLPLEVIVMIVFIQDKKC